MVLKMPACKTCFTIRKVVGVVFIGLAVYDFYNFIVGEEQATHNWWCKVPVIGGLFCNLTTDFDLVFGIIFALAGVYLLAS